MKFMMSETMCWHFDILLTFWYLGKILGKIARFSANVFLPARFWYLDENLGKISLQMSPRFSRSFWPLRFWDLVELSARILASFWTPRFQDVVGISARISWVFGHWDFKILPGFRRDLGENFGKVFGQRDRRDLGGQKLTEISARSLGQNFAGELLQLILTATVIIKCDWWIFNLTGLVWIYSIKSLLL